MCFLYTHTHRSKKLVASLTNPEGQLNKVIAALKISETDLFINTWSSFCFTMI